MKLARIGLFACAVAFLAGCLSPVSADQALTLSGCLVKAQSGSGYLLINSAFDPALEVQDDSHLTPSAVGTSGDFTHTFYWLDGDRALGRNIGHRVEIVGYLQDIKDGELKVDRKDNWTDVTVKSDGRTLKAQVPNASIIAPTDVHRDESANVIVKRVDVDRVKMLSANCR